jgi:hypothetical protein
MEILKAYSIENIDGNFIFNGNSSENYVNFIKDIAKENGDNETIFDGTVEQAEKYVLNFCPNLKIF